ncbi:MAG: acyloxyacyl hydrolase [Desulfobacterales bacterium]|nr:acyloxyacyl hydrolase [Desulfobacterales bacterium]
MNLFMRICLMAIMLSLGTAVTVTAGEKAHAPAKNGVSLNLGYTYDPSDNIWLGQVSFFKLYDYDAVWPHRAPEALRFKVEGSLGSSRLDNGDLRMNAGANIFALYYIRGLETDHLRPYAEAGIGVMYTDYRVNGQDYRFNFNPQAGLGVEFKKEDDTPCFLAVRLHHLSNAGIGSDNRGLNSVVCMFGRYF